MEKLLAHVAERPERLIDMPYGIAAYVMLALGTASMVTPYEGSTVVGFCLLAMFFRLIQSGRQHVHPDRLRKAAIEYKDFPGIFQEWIAQYEITNRHMGRMGQMMIVFATVAAFVQHGEDFALWLAGL